MDQKKIPDFTRRPSKGFQRKLASIHHEFYAFVVYPPGLIPHAPSMIWRGRLCFVERDAFLSDILELSQPIKFGIQWHRDKIGSKLRTTSPAKAVKQLNSQVDVFLAHRFEVGSGNIKRRFLVQALRTWCCRESWLGRVQVQVEDLNIAASRRGCSLVSATNTIRDRDDRTSADCSNVAQSLLIADGGETDRFRTVCSHRFSPILLTVRVLHMWTAVSDATAHSVESQAPFAIEAPVPPSL